MMLLSLPCIRTDYGFKDRMEDLVDALIFALSILCHMKVGETLMCVLVTKACHIDTVFYLCDVICRAVSPVKHTPS